MSGLLLSSSGEVIWGLISFTDWWQPHTGSVVSVGPARRSKTLGDGIRPGLLDTLDERAELSRRMQLVSERDRELLFLWYVRQSPVEEIASTLGISRRQCFRRRGSAIRKIVELAEPGASS